MSACRLYYALRERRTTAYRIAWWLIFGTPLVLLGYSVFDEVMRYLVSLLPAVPSVGAA